MKSIVRNAFILILMINFLSCNKNIILEEPNSPFYNFRDLLKENNGKINLNDLKNKYKQEGNLYLIDEDSIFLFIEKDQQIISIYSMKNELNKRK